LLKETFIWALDEPMTTWLTAASLHK